MDVHRHVPKNKLRIAVIDDEEAVYVGMRALVETEGDYRVDYFDSPETFLGQANAEDFDCILLDLCFSFGGMTGMDLLKHFSGLPLSTPIIMLTAERNADLPTAFAMRDLGAAGILIKPVTRFRLWEVLRKAMLPPRQPAPAPVVAQPSPTWESFDLEEADPKQLKKGDLPDLHRRVGNKLNMDESCRFASLTLTETKVFLLRAQHAKPDKELAKILGIEPRTWQTHVENAAKKLGSRSVLQWRILFDKINA